MTTIYSKYSNPPDYNLKEYKNRYVTSNDEQYGCALMSKKETSTSGRAAQQARRFNKRKSPYQQFSDAKYNFGVYFNPVMNGLWILNNKVNDFITKFISSILLLIWRWITDTGK